ncbi:hypothetical protein ZIOFF_042180 [Zingiber officinale]|uniref:U-box domain-containing protein n=1 Tax=Zingiber officinale TaxID=94328 RepID=A0A8J5GDN8_ZINOF|nr:hypothetical protein ZIOFF_042180 [Zingiber officinale]
MQPMRWICQQSPVIDLPSLALRRDVLVIELIASGRRHHARLEQDMECDVADGLVDERWAIVMVALASILQYGSYVIFGTLTPQLGSSSGDSKLPLSATEDLMVPDDFKCSISLEMMRDPMVVAIGQTYDRDSIACAETTIFPLMDPTTPWNKMTVSTDNASTHTKTNKATLEADEFATASLTDDVHWIVDELQLLAKHGFDNHAFLPPWRRPAQFPCSSHLSNRQTPGFRLTSRLSCSTYRFWKPTSGASCTQMMSSTTSSTF